MSRVKILQIEIFNFGFDIHKAQNPYVHLLYKVFILAMCLISSCQLSWLYVKYRLIHIVFHVSELSFISLTWW